MRFVLSVVIALCMATSLHADSFGEKLNKELLDGVEKLIEEGVDYMEDSRKRANVSDKATRGFIIR